MLITAVIGLACNLVNIFVLEASIESKEEKVQKEIERTQSHCHQPQLEALSRNSSILKRSLRSEIDRMARNPPTESTPVTEEKRKSIDENKSVSSFKHVHNDEERHLSQALITQ